jgi:hypothetical protein
VKVLKHKIGKGYKPEQMFHLLPLTWEACEKVALMETRHAEWAIRIETMLFLLEQLVLQCHLLNAIYFNTQRN